MNWQEVYADKHLHNLPYKIELNEQGQTLMRKRPRNSVPKGQPENSPVFQRRARKLFN